MLRGEARGPALAALGLAIFFWATVPLLLKLFARTLDSWTVNAMRYAFTLLFWTPYLLRTRRELGRGRAIWRDAWLPAAVHLVGQILFGLTPYYNDATIINFVSRVAFLFTALFGLAWLPEERVLLRRPLFWLAFGGAAAGLWVIYAGGRGAVSTSALGMAVLIGTSLCWGLYSVLIRMRMKRYPARLTHGVISLGVAPFLLALMFVFGDWRRLLLLGPGSWFLLALSGVAGLALGHTLFYRAIHALGPVFSEGSLLLIPFLTASLAALALGERLRPLQWCGGVVLVCSSLALLLDQWRRRPARAAAARRVVTASAGD